MTLIFNFLKTYLISIVILFLLFLIIWLRGPELTIWNLSPLETTEQRFCVTALAFIVWFLKLIFIDTNPKKTINNKPSLSPGARKKLQRLQGRFYGAIEFLKKTVITKHDKKINLLRLPWYLIIGPTGAGKSTLLANANINFILAKNLKSGNAKVIAQSDMCDWWATRDVVLVDIPGAYLVSKTNSSPPAHSLYHLLWQHLLRLVQQFHRKKTLHGVIIALNLPEIIKQHRQQKNQVLHDIKKRVNELLDTFGPQLPIHLVITKCDLLPGFIEFFGECSTDETGQSWGITIPPRTENENLIDVFMHRFNVLIKRLNKQLISKLHQERNPNARPYIKDFPLHIEQLKEGIAQFLKALMIPHLQIQGIYLTSGKQDDGEDEHNTYLSSTLSNANTQALQIMSTPVMPSRSYFVRQLILHNLLATSPQPDQKIKHKNIWQRRIVYTTSIGAIITASIFLGRDFQTGVQQAYSIQNELAQYQLRIQQSNQKTEHFTTALPLLNSLKQAATHTTDKLLLEFYSNKSQQTARTVYQQALQTIVIPEIKNYFENYLKAASNKNSENVYQILKAYLMLGDKEHFQADFVTKILQQLMPGTANKEVLSELSSHIHAALNTTQLSVKLDNQLITDVRDQLLNLPNTTLGFVILKNNDNNTDSAIELGNHLINSSVFTSNVIATQIPSMFTAKGFQKIAGEEANKIAAEVLGGNWILGYNPNPINQLTVNELAAQLQAQYIANYVDIWESFLANIQLRTPQNLAQVNSMIAILTGNNSPLLLLLDTFKQNTSFAPVLAASPKLQNLSVLLVDATNNQPGGLYGIFVGLKQLHSYLQSILSTPDAGKSLLDATAKRMQDPSKDPLTQIQAIAETSPEPMKTWLNTIATQTWHYMVLETGQHIETAWQKNVMETYHSAIASRYPFNQTAEKEVELQQFTQFLGQPGQLSEFYQTYLKPFIIEFDKKRKWRIVNNQQLPFADSIFDKFDHANRIQRVFFPNGDNKLYVPFTLHPVALDKNMKGFTININGQEVRYQKNMPRLVTWPGNNSLQVTSINFVTQNNSLLSQTTPGNWGWFRLVTNATETIRSRKELALTFDIDGHKAKYALFTQGHLNPFLPLNLSRFELPEHLG